ncbi:alpha/beta hydrolase [candidate division KSB1 bacterium]
MKRSIYIILTVVYIFFTNCSTPLPNDPGSQGRKLFFTSRYTEEISYILVYVPQKTDGPVPVIYMLNGSMQDAYGWETGADLQGGADKYDMIIVSIASYDKPYIDDYLNGDLYESYVLEIVEIVDGLFDTKTSRDFRGIGGYSMGGAGSLYVGSRHPDKFISITSMSGGYSNTEQPNWDNLKNQLIYIDCGIDDTGTIDTNRLVHQLLINYDIPHFYYEYRGGHTYSYMKEHYDEHLNFHSEAFKLNE